MGAVLLKIAQVSIKLRQVLNLKDGMGNERGRDGGDGVVLAFK